MGIQSAEYRGACAVGLRVVIAHCLRQPEAEPADDTPEEEAQANDDEDEEMHDGEYDDNEEHDGRYNHNEEHGENTENIYPSLEEEPPSTPAAPSAPLRPLGRFMTPQAPSAFPRPAARARASLGGPALGLSSSVSGALAGPRRVRLVEPWKISDIVVPPAPGDIKTEGDDAAAVKEERAASVVPGPGTPRRDRVSEEEKRVRPPSPAFVARRTDHAQAIRERRKSALTTPDTFFNGRAPGVRPGPSTASSSSAPAPLPPLFPAPPSPVKAEDGGEDAGVLLARMREMVAGVRRRQSGVGAEDVPRRASLSPRKRAGFSLLARDEGGADTIVEEQEQEQGGADAPVPVAAAPREVGTPQMGDLRHLFGAPAQAATPQLKGVREMFRPVRPSAGMEDAALEGVGEMMSSPVGWRGKAAAQAHEEEDDEEEDPAPARGPKGKAAASRRTPKSVATRKEAPASELAAVEEDEVAAPVEPQPPAARVARRTRTRTAESDQVSFSRCLVMFVV